MEKKKNRFPAVRFIVAMGLLGATGYQGYQFYQKYINRVQILEQIASRLKADSRIAEVLVTDVHFNPLTQTHMTTIKFLEYDWPGNPLPPKYFTFSGNMIQFQSLVVRFDDVFVEKADALRGKSAYLFWKVFILDGQNTQEQEITKVETIPDGYKIDGPRNAFEEEIWREFWKYALDSKKAITKGIKNAQLEAPGTKFVPGVLYTLKIEHGGGIRIDAKEIPDILKGEKILE